MSRSRRELSQPAEDDVDPNILELRTCERKNLQMDQKLKKLEQSSKEHQSAIKNQKEKALGLERQIEELKRQNLLQLEENAREHENAINHLQSAIKTLEAKVVEQEGSKSQLEGEIGKLNAKLAEQTNKETVLLELEQSGYVYHLKGFSYNFHSVLLDWENAEKICQSEGAHLASIHSNEENKFLFDLINKDGAHWIGLKYVEQKWIWSDGSATDYLNWKPDEPNGMANGNRWVGLWWDEGKWVATKTNKPFICKKRLGSTIPGKTISIISPERKALIEMVKFGYTHHFDGSFYKIYSILLDWEKAEEICHSEGAHLASIHSYGENQFLLGLIKDSLWHYSIGLQYVGQKWIWSDGSVTDYINWKPDEPNGMADGYRWVRLRYDYGKWETTKTKRPFICKKRLPI